MSGSEVASLLRWLLALEIIGWALYPLLYLLTPGLRDRGLTVAKPFALLLLTYPAWFLAALGLPVFTRTALVATGIAGAAVAWWLGLRRAAPSRPPILGRATGSASSLPSPDGEDGGGNVIPFLRSSWRYVLAVEALFIAAFLGYAWLRGFNPQILGTEKPMEIGFFSAATRQETMPPRDPWLSGYGINYYYFGYAILAAVAKLTAISSSIAFNLGLATVFAATVSGGAGLVANLVAGRDTKGGALSARALGPGLLGGYLLALAGNMYAARDILERGREAIDTWWWGGLGWKSSRVIVDSGWPGTPVGVPAQPVENINEFPFFSFILGDLHAHVLALPFTLLALAFALDAWQSPLRPDWTKPANGDDAVGGSTERGRATRWSILPPAWALPRLLAAAIVIGSLYAINSWDLPTYAALYLAALLVPAWIGRRRLIGHDWAAAGLFVALCLALFAPFYAGFTSLVGGEPFELPEPWRSIPLLPRLSAVLGLVIWDKTPADQFFTVYLLPFVVGLIFLSWRWASALPQGTDRTKPALVVLALALGATLLRMPVFFFAGLIVLLAAVVLLCDPVPPRPPALGGATDADLGSPARRWGAGGGNSDDFATLLFGSAFVLVLATEVFFIHDVFANRMNTVFKVYYQAWTLLSVAAGYACWRTIDGLRSRATSGRLPSAELWRVPAAGAMALLLVASTAYPLVGSRARTAEFGARSSLDGLDFVRTVQPEEWAGIRWVREHVPAGAVVAEAPGCSYGEWRGLPHNRVSAFAGVSTPIGWGGHEAQWRGGSPELLAAIAPRKADVNTLFRTTDPAEATRLLDHYGIDYVYVGYFERNGYAAGGIGADCVDGGAYAAAGLAKFDTMMDRVFASDGGSVVIYRRR